MQASFNGTFSFNSIIEFAPGQNSPFCKKNRAVHFGTEKGHNGIVMAANSNKPAYVADVSKKSDDFRD